MQKDVNTGVLAKFIQAQNFIIEAQAAWTKIST